MKMPIPRLTAAIVLLIASGIAVSDSGTTQPNTSSWIYQSGDLIGRTVIDSLGNELGTVQDLLFDKAGKMQYFILSRNDGIVGLGETTILVPWPALSGLKVDSVSGRYVASIDQNDVDNAKKLAPFDLPSSVNPTITREVDRYITPDSVPATAMNGNTSSSKIRERFDKLDTDSSGTLSRKEASKSDHVSNNFGGIDTDDSGDITRAEYSAYSVSQ